MKHILLMAGAAWVLCQGGLAQAPPATSQNAALRLTLEEAMERARANSPQIFAAGIAAQLAHEDRVQAKAALLPTLDTLNQFIYTQPNGAPSGTFVSNDGAHVYNNQAIVHGDIYAPVKRADYRKAQVGEAVARAKADIAARGLIATVVQDYYAMVSAARKRARRSGVISPRQRTARPGPGKGCRHTNPAGSPSASPTARTSSLNR